MLEYITQLTFWSAKYFQLMPSFLSFLEIFTLPKKYVFLKICLS